MERRILAMANVTSSGRRLRRSPPTRDQTIRAVFDRDGTASPPAHANHGQSYNWQYAPAAPPRADNLHCSSQPATMLARNDNYVSHRGMLTSPRHPASRIPLPSNTGRASAQPCPSSPPPYHISRNAPADDGNGMTINTDSHMEWEQSIHAADTQQHHNLEQFQSGYFYEHQHRINGESRYPSRLYPTAMRPPSSFAYEMSQVPDNSTADLENSEGGCTCGHQHCPQVHYIEPSTVRNQPEYHYETVPGTFRHVSPAELTLAYSNAHTFGRAARPRPTEYEQDWHIREQFTKPFLYDIEQARSEGSYRGGASPHTGQGLRGQFQSHCNHNMAVDVMEARALGVEQYSRRASPEGLRSPPPHMQDAEVSEVAMVEIRTPGGMGVRIVEASRRFANGQSTTRE